MLPKRLSVILRTHSIASQCIICSTWWQVRKLVPLLPLFWLNQNQEAPLKQGTMPQWQLSISKLIQILYTAIPALAPAGRPSSTLLASSSLELLRILAHIIILIEASQTQESKACVTYFDLRKSLWREAWLMSSLKWIGRRCSRAILTWLIILMLKTPRKMIKSWLFKQSCKTSSRNKRVDKHSHRLTRWNLNTSSSSKRSWTWSTRDSRSAKPTHGTSFSSLALLSPFCCSLVLFPQLNIPLSGTRSHWCSLTNYWRWSSPKLNMSTSSSIT